MCPVGQTHCATASPYTDRPPGCYDLATTWNACGSCDAMPCTDPSSGQPGTCANGACATTPP